MLDEKFKAGSVASSYFTEWNNRLVYIQSSIRLGRQEGQMPSFSEVCLRECWRLSSCEEIIFSRAIKNQSHTENGRLVKSQTGKGQRYRYR